MAKRDYYDVLGVSKGSSADQIKTAYPGTVPINCNPSECKYVCIQGIDRKDTAHRRRRRLLTQSKATC